MMGNRNIGKLRRQAAPFARRAAVLCAATLLGAGGAQAVTIDQSQFFSFGTSYSSPANLTEARTDNLFATRILTFDQFDPSLGTLMQVRVVLTGNNSVRSSATFRDPDGFSDTAGEVRVAAVIETRVGARDIDAFNVSRSDTCSATGVLSAPSCTATAAGSGLYVSEATFLFPYASLIGTGTFQVPVDLVGTLYTNETDGDDGYTDYRSATISTAGSYYIGFDYEPFAPPPPPPPVDVPAPASLALLGLGLAGIGVRGRAHRR